VVSKRVAKTVRIVNINFFIRVHLLTSF